MNYQECSVEELADYVEISSPQRITQQLSYYKKKENQEIVDKILEARKIVKIRKLKKKLEQLQ